MKGLIKCVYKWLARWGWRHSVAVEYDVTADGVAFWRQSHVTISSSISRLTDITRETLYSRRLTTTDEVYVYMNCQYIDAAPGSFIWGAIYSPGGLQNASPPVAVGVQRLEVSQNLKQFVDIYGGYMWTKTQKLFRNYFSDVKHVGKYSSDIEIISK